jgi:hypothetical protein
VLKAFVVELLMNNGFSTTEADLASIGLNAVAAVFFLYFFFKY